MMKANVMHLFNDCIFSSSSTQIQSLRDLSEPEAMDKMTILLQRAWKDKLKIENPEGTFWRHVRPIAGDPEF